MGFTTLEEWLNWLEQQHPESDIELGLARVGAVADRLDLRRPAAKVITVAGTNGKGSCAALLEHLLLDAGYSVGVFTSPHFTHYCERIRVNGQQASDADVCEAFDRIQAARLTPPDAINLSYFEFGALAALSVFARHQVDIMVLEVGLGGRLDAVNIIDADVAIITSIDIDHEDWLGSDRETIGREKAGIMRSGKPVVCADQQAPASIAETAKSVGARLLSVGQEWHFQVSGDHWQWDGVLGIKEGTKENGQESAVYLSNLPIPSLPLPSVAAGLQALSLLGLEFTQQQLTDLLPAINLTGRYQKQNLFARQLILDVAHNPAAAELLASRLEGEPKVQKTLAVVGMMADKDRARCLAALTPLVDEWLPASLPSIPRAAAGADLREDLLALPTDSSEPVGTLPPSIQAYDTVALALEAALDASDEGDRILIMGSFFTVAEALAHIKNLEQQNGFGE